MTLVVVSGPPGSGKTTLAHKLAAAIGCPAICRDEIKEGMARSAPGFEAAPGDELTHQTFVVFFDVLRVLVAGGVTVVAEAAFQDHVWTPNLAPLAELTDLRIVQCHSNLAVARQRIAERGASRPAHADTALLAELEHGDDYFTNFQRVAIDAPSIDVDTTNGYTPTIDDIVAFVGA